MKQKKDTLSVIIPIYNEESCIDELVRRLIELKDNFDNVALSFVFVNDGSIDKSLDMLVKYAQRYKFFKIIKLSRNFGHQLAITAGIDHTDTDYAVIIDADLQDPPELIKNLYSKVKEGYDIVYAKREKRKGESRIKLITAKWFYYLINKLCKVDIPTNTGDFRIINNKLLIELKGMREQHRFLRGMIPWLGFKSTALYYKRDSRLAGETKYTFKKMINLALDAIFSFSFAPLRIATYLGLTVVLIGIFIGITVIIIRFFTPYAAPGASTIIVTIILLGGIQIIMIGIMGEYIGRIFEESKRRPLYVVDSLVNFSD